MRKEGLEPSPSCPDRFLRPARLPIPPLPQGARDRAGHRRRSIAHLGDERKAAIAQALATLDDDVRSALELTYFEGLTAPEISARLAIPIGTVRSRLARGLERLRALLQVTEKGAGAGHE